MEQFGISKLDLKRRNRTQILKLLRQQGPTSRIDLSMSLDLTRAAVTIICNEMIGQGILYEKGELNTVGKKASRGRKKILIDINKNFRFAFGVAINNHKIYIGLSNLGGDILEKRQFEVQANDTQQTILRRIFTDMRLMLENSCLNPAQIVGVGVCMNRRAAKMLDLKDNADGSTEYSILEEAFQQYFPFPATFHSIIDGLAAAELDFSEQYPSEENIVMIRFSDHVTAAFAMGHNIYRGYHHQAMDLAHMIVNPQGKLCRCGLRGCVAQEFSEEELYVNIIEMFSKEKTPQLYEKMGGNPNRLRVAEVYEYATLGDEGVDELFRSWFQSFHVFLNNLIKIIDPQRIVFFGRQFENEAFMELLKSNVAKAQGEAAAEMIKASHIRQDNIYLTGCSMAIRKYFVEKGGIFEK